MWIQSDSPAGKMADIRRLLLLCAIAALRDIPRSTTTCGNASPACPATQRRNRRRRRRRETRPAPRISSRNPDRPDGKIGVFRKLEWTIVRISLPASILNDSKGGPLGVVVRSLRGGDRQLRGSRSAPLGVVRRSLRGGHRDPPGCRSGPLRAAPRSLGGGDRVPGGSGAPPFRLRRATFDLRPDTSKAPPRPGAAVRGATRNGSGNELVARTGCRARQGSPNQSGGEPPQSKRR